MCCGSGWVTRFLFCRHCRQLSQPPVCFSWLDPLDCCCFCWVLFCQSRASVWCFFLLAVLCWNETWKWKVKFTLVRNSFGPSYEFPMVSVCQVLKPTLCHVSGEKVLRIIAHLWLHAALQSNPFFSNTVQWYSRPSLGSLLFLYVPRLFWNGKLKCSQWYFPLKFADLISQDSITSVELLLAVLVQ